MRRRLINQFLLSALLTSVPARAQTDGVPAEPAAKVKDGLDDYPYLMPRAAGMAGAVGNVADDREAAFTNPSGIGGRHFGKQKLPWVRKLYFPHFAVAANDHSSELLKEARGKGAIQDSTIGKAIVDANAGDRQYARFGVNLGMVLGRTLILPYTDLQVAATPRGQGSNLIDFREMTTTGAGIGWSVASPDETLVLGAFNYVANRNEVKGAFLYNDIISAEARKTIMKENATTSTGTGHNVGLTWRMGKRATPTFGLAMRDMGNTKYKKTKGTGEAPVVKQNLGAQFSLSPTVGKSGEFNFALDADRLLDDEVTLAKKFRAGVELLLGGPGSYAIFGVRAGYSMAGPSAGLSLNVGLISLDAAMSSVDIGVGNEKVVERRFIGSIYVNVAEF